LNEWKLTGEGKGDKNGINSQRERARERDRLTEKEKKSGEIPKTKRDAEKYKDLRSHFSCAGLWL
jgi:hypothetical protein